MVPIVAPVLNEDLDQPALSLLCDDPRWQLAQRIVASKCFAKSSFLTSFLLYVCDRELRGRAQEITEHQIGIQAFGRPATYNPGDDNIVRNYARLLRKRLEEYFNTEGKDEPLRVSVPRGRYVPVFYYEGPIEPELPEPSLLPNRGSGKTRVEDRIFLTERMPETAMPPKPRRKLRALLLALCMLLAALTAAWFGISYFSHRQDTLSHQLWSQLFNHERETLIVPADSGFGILQNLTRHPVHLTDYANGDYLSKIHSVAGVDSRNLNDLSTQRYTSVVDLNIASSLSRLPELVPDRFVIRYARDLRMEDLKHSNAILLGSQHTNPWVELFQNDTNFVLVYQPEVDDSFVLNRRPLPGENAVYKNAWADDSHRTYTVLAYIPSLDGVGHVILVEGLNMAGTQAAADFLLNDRTISPILKKAMRADGTLQPFELLLETNSIGANAPEARVVAERYGISPQQ
jgi:hypothetical protein